MAQTSIQKSNQKSVQIFHIHTLVLIILCLGLCFFATACAKKAPKVDAIAKNGLENGLYDSVYLSTQEYNKLFPFYFEQYRGTSTLCIETPMKTESDFCDYLTAIFAIDPSLSTVFLELNPSTLKLTDDPEKDLLKDPLLRFMGEHPDTSFQIMLSHPGVPYYLSLSDKRREKEGTAGIRLANDVSYSTNGSTLPNRVHLYFPGSQEWLVTNTANYTEEYATVEQITFKLFLLCFCDGAYEMTSDNAVSYYDELDALCENPLVYPNLHNEEFYFIGDSIFGNDTGVLSIPGMITGLTDAWTYNYGVGGATAAICSTAPTNFKEICESNDFPGYTSATVFINFGLNDYMQGVSVEAYKKALIDQTSRLMKANKDLRIIILSPSYCTFFEEGTIPQGSDGSPLQDYRVAAKEAADSLGVELFDSYTILGFDASNADLYLADGCHMTEAGRFIMSQKLIEFITSKTDD